MCNAFFLSEEANFLKKKCFVDSNFISLIHSYVYIHIALCYQELYLLDSSSYDTGYGNGQRGTQQG